MLTAGVLRRTIHRLPAIQKIKQLKHPTNLHKNLYTGSLQTTASETLYPNTQKRHLSSANDNTFIQNTQILTAHLAATKKKVTRHQQRNSQQFNCEYDLKEGISINTQIPIDTPFKINPEFHSLTEKDLSVSWFGEHINTLDLPLTKNERKKLNNRFKKLMRTNPDLLASLALPDLKNRDQLLLYSKTLCLLYGIDDRIDELNCFENVKKAFANKDLNDCYDKIYESINEIQAIAYQHDQLISLIAKEIGEIPLSLKETLQKHKLILFPKNFTPTAIDAETLIYHKMFKEIWNESLSLSPNPAETTLKIGHEWMAYLCHGLGEKAAEIERLTKTYQSITPEKLQRGQLELSKPIMPKNIETYLQQRLIGGGINLSFDVALLLLEPHQLNNQQWTYKKAANQIAIANDIISWPLELEQADNCCSLTSHHQSLPKGIHYLFKETRQEIIGQLQPIISNESFGEEWGEQQKHTHIVNTFVGSINHNINELKQKPDTYTTILFDWIIGYLRFEEISDRHETGIQYQNYHYQKWEKEIANPKFYENILYYDPKIKGNVLNLSYKKLPAEIIYLIVSRCPNIEKIKALNLTGNELTEIPKLPLLWENLKVLNVSENFNLILNDTAFHGLSLETLNISDCNWSDTLKLPQSLQLLECRKDQTPPPLPHGCHISFTELSTINDQINYYKTAYQQTTAIPKKINHLEKLLDLYNLNKKNDEAIKTVSEIINILKTETPLNSEKICKMMRNKAILQSSIHDFDGAVATMHVLETFYKTYIPTDPLQKFNINETLGDIYLLKQRNGCQESKKLAENYYKNIFEIYYRLLVNDPSKETSIEVATYLDKYSEVLSDDEQKKQLAKLAINTIMPFISTKPTTKENRKNLITMGRILDNCASRIYSDALNHKNIPELKQLLTYTKQTQTLFEKTNVGNTLNVEIGLNALNLGKIQKSIGDYNAAKVSWEKSFTILNNIPFQKPLQFELLRLLNTLIKEQFPAELPSIQNKISTFIEECINSEKPIFQNFNSLRNLLDIMNNISNIEPLSILYATEWYNLHQTQNEQDIFNTTLLQLKEHSILLNEGIQNMLNSHRKYEKALKITDYFISQQKKHTEIHPEIMAKSLYLRSLANVPLNNIEAAKKDSIESLSYYEQNPHFPDLKIILLTQHAQFFENDEDILRVRKDIVEEYEKLSPQPHYDKAIAYWNLSETMGKNNKEESIELLEKANAILNQLTLTKPFEIITKADIQVALGLQKIDPMNLIKQKNTEALNHFETGLKVIYDNPTLSDIDITYASLLTGHILLFNNNQSAALYYFKKSLEFESKTRNIQHNIVDIYKQTAYMKLAKNFSTSGQYAKGLELLDKINSINFMGILPPHYYSTKIDCLMGINKFNETIKVADTALSTDVTTNPSEIAHINIQKQCAQLALGQDIGDLTDIKNLIESLPSQNEQIGYYTALALSLTQTNHLHCHNTLKGIQVVNNILILLDKINDDILLKSHFRENQYRYFKQFNKITSGIPNLHSIADLKNAFQVLQVRFFLYLQSDPDYFHTNIQNQLGTQKTIPLLTINPLNLITFFNFENEKSDYWFELASSRLFAVQSMHYEHLSEKLTDEKKSLALFNKATTTLKNKLTFLEKVGYSDYEIAHTYGMLGQCYIRHKETSKGLIYCFKAKKIFDDIYKKDPTMSGKALILHLIGQVTQNTESTEKAINYYKESLECFKDVNPDELDYHKRLDVLFRLILYYADKRDIKSLDNYIKDLETHLRTHKKSTLSNDQLLLIQKIKLLFKLS
ncbi:hypothetical protein DID76_03150 [Candidatus Marinamargulisbacteria bacterium SCGC AG-414-C22]|nr:hypothetical protein DID76_03150 [Candidatus Marinamargulisbacteria bacterium SCGC AG-414-C22]